MTQTTFYIKCCFVCTIYSS